MNATKSRLGVWSEAGRLRRVLVCAPGLAHQRLTPENSSELLFDDVIWLQSNTPVVPLSSTGFVVFLGERQLRGRDGFHEVVAVVCARTRDADLVADVPALVDETAEVGPGAPRQRAESATFCRR